MNAFRLNECTGYISTWDGCYPFTSTVAASLGVSPLHLRIHAIIARPHKSCKKVLSLLRDAGATLQLEECNFFTGKNDYHFHAIRPCRLEIATRTTDAIKGLKPRTNKTELFLFFVL